MNLQDLADITGKSISEVKKMLDEQDTVDVNLKESKRSQKDAGSIEVV